MRRFLPLLLVLLAACGPDAPTPAPARGGAARVAPAMDAAAIASGYRERLRLGLGGPFRLVEIALLDPRLAERDRQALAGELLRRIAAGEFLAPDAALLAPAGGDLLPAWRHLDLVTRTVEGAADPRGGELTIRLGYQLARMERSVDAPTASAALRIASLVRDRELARRDAARLLRFARSEGKPASALLPAWRRERRFEVEAPALQELPSGIEIGAIEAVPALNSALRTLWLRAPERPPEPGPAPAERVALARLAAAMDTVESLPHATLVAMLRQMEARLPEDLPTETRESWARFASSAETEEGFATGYFALIEREPALRPLAASVALRAAVGLRAYAQERPWSPTDPALTPESLRERHGILVRVADDVPESWTAPTLSALDESLGELRELLPSLSLLGLRVEVTRESRIAGALASHSPRERVLEWPVATGAGTLAHEIAHDLDWQTARRARSRGYGYASSRAAAAGRGSFAAALAVLTPESMATGHATRAPEVLARGFEWFVLTQMAARGRWNGVLSSAQDEVLTGHGSLVAPAVSEAYGPAVIEALRPLVSIDAEQRRKFLARHGPERWPRASLILRSMGERLAKARGDGWGGATAPSSGFQAVATARDATLAELAEVLDPAPVAFVDPRLAARYRELVSEAARAEGRAVALEVARAAAGEPGSRWMLRELYGPLWPAAQIEPAVEVLLAEVAARARDLGAPPVIPRPPLWWGRAG